jgi:cytochrome c biogenesis protein CcmG/thiol:disulfide interchange protein DsbE
MTRKIQYVVGPVLLLAFCLFQTSCVTTKPISVGPWELKDVNGRTVKSSDFDGKIVLLNFWATWCPPCREEIPTFNDLYKANKDRGLVIVGVAMDEEGASVVSEFMKKKPMDYPVVIGEQKLLDTFGIQVIPTTFVIDRQGKTVATQVGKATREEFEKYLAPLW